VNLKPSVYDVVVYRLSATGDGTRWLVTRGDAHLFESDEKHAAVALGCTVAHEQKVQCFLSDDFGVRNANCARYPLRKERPVESSEG
jgi:predicted transcriptional regulator